MQHAATIVRRNPVEAAILLGQAGELMQYHVQTSKRATAGFRTMSRLVSEQLQVFVWRHCHGRTGGKHVVPEARRVIGSQRSVRGRGDDQRPVFHTQSQMPKSAALSMLLGML